MLGWNAPSWLVPACDLLSGFGFLIMGVVVIAHDLGEHVTLRRLPLLAFIIYLAVPAMLVWVGVRALWRGARRRVTERRK